MFFLRRSFQAIPVVVWLLLLSTGAYAFSQLSNAPTAPLDGRVSGVSGYTVTNIAYTLSAADASRIAKVAFMLTPSSSAARITTVRAKLVSASSGYSSCANSPVGSKRWECPISGVAVAAADQLRVDVADLSVPKRYGLLLPVIRGSGSMRFVPLVSR